MEIKYIITETSNNKEEIIISFDNYEDALIFLQELITRFHYDGNRVDLRIIKQK